MIGDLPGWAERELERSRRMFGLDGNVWFIESSMSNAPGGNERADGCTRVKPEYFIAEVTLNKKIRNDRHGRETIQHELLHVALGELNDVVMGILNEIPADHRTFFTERYVKATERAVTRLTRSLVDEMERMEQGGGTTRRETSKGNCGTAGDNKRTDGNTTLTE